jgi:hypothetical protein
MEPLLLLAAATAVSAFEQACIHPKIIKLAVPNPTFSIKSFLSILVGLKNYNIYFKFLFKYIFIKFIDRNKNPFKL